MKLPIAAMTKFPEACVSVIDAPELIVTLPPDTNATESENVAAPETLMLPVLLLPIVMFVNPSANLRVPPTPLKR